MRWLAWLAGLVFLRCPHRHRLYVRDERGHLWLVCDRCGHAVEALR